MKNFRVVCDPITDSEGYQAGKATELLMIEQEGLNSRHAANIARQKLNIHPANYAVFTWDIEEEKKYKFKQEGGCWETCEKWGESCHVKPTDGGPCEDKYQPKKEG